MTGMITNVIQTVLQNAGMQVTNTTTQYIGHVVKHHSKNIVSQGVKHAVRTPIVSNSVNTLSIEALRQSQAANAMVVVLRDASEKALKQSVKHLVARG